MTRRTADPKRCSYVIALGASELAEEELLELARYLSTLGRTGVETIVADGSSDDRFERNRSIFRWVARHVRSASDAIAPLDSGLRAALAVAGCEKIIVAECDVRYSPEGLDQTCDLLDLYDAIEPQDYYDPLPWWGGIDMSRVLMHRAFDARAGQGAAVAFRRAVLASRTPAGAMLPELEQLDVQTAPGVFVSRKPPTLAEWLGTRAADAARDFDRPARTVLFFAAAPLLFVLALLGGAEIAASYAGVISLASMVIALRGGIAARGGLPLRACLFAPLWLVERSITVYAAALRRLRRGRAGQVAERVGEARGGSRLASGE